MLQPAAPGEREVMTQTSIATATDRVSARRPGLSWANDALRSSGLRRTLRVVAELALLSLLYAGYEAGRAAIGIHTGSALGRGRWILDAESLAHLDVELPLNRLVSAVPPVGLLFAYLYATLHYVLTPATLIWVAARRPSGYLRARNGILVATAMGLVGYWLLPDRKSRRRNSSPLGLTSAVIRS